MLRSEKRLSWQRRSASSQSCPSCRARMVCPQASEIDAEPVVAALGLQALPHVHQK